MFLYIYIYIYIYIEIGYGWAAQHDPFVLGPISKRSKIAFGPAAAGPK